MQSQYYNHYHKTWIEISKKALLGNAKILCGILGQKTRLMAVVKANAYGHGLKEVVSVLKEQPGIMFGVDSFDEAVGVKTIAPKSEVMILGYISEKDLAVAIKNGFHFSIYDESIFRSVARLVQTDQINPETIKAHIKIETGTNRLGMKPDELKNTRFEFPITGIYTHLADSEDLSSSFYKEQIRKLDEAVEILKDAGIKPRYVHFACTAAAMRGLVGNGNLARMGISLYGLWPSGELKEKFSRKIKLEPVLSWKTKIIQIKRVSKGKTIGYGRTYKAKNETSIAVLPIGYYDGYDRGLSQRGEVLINGKRAKIAGRVCMNMTMVDLGGIKAKTGDEVILIGKSGKEQITADELAQKIGTINYEVVSRINPLLSRIFI